MKRIGLTGSIGAGKSTVSARLKELGAFVIDADAVSHELTEKGSYLLLRLRDAFGEEILSSDGSLNRRRLSSIVFSDDRARKKMESIIHPAVFKRMQEIEDANENENIVIYDVPLLFETGMNEDMDELWVVDAPREERIRRLEKRSKMTRAEAESRIRAQMKDEEKRNRADVLIENDGSREELIRKVDSLWQSIEK